MDDAPYPYSEDPARNERDVAWVEREFGDVGPAPDNAIRVDPDAERSPNIERPCEGEVTDD
jgi:hypothetical protein